MMQLRELLSRVANTLATVLVFVSFVLALGTFVGASEQQATLLGWMLIVIFFAFLFYVLAATILPERHFRHAAYQAAGFLILALSVRAFGLHDTVQTLVKQVLPSVADARAQNRIQPAGSISELCAIMMLFVLVEIAAFVARDVEEARSNVIAAAKLVEGALEKVEYLELIARMRTLDSKVMSAAFPLVNLWSVRAPNTPARDLSTRCWSILLQKYLQEECADLKIERISEGVPPSVQPVGDPLQDYDINDVSLIATNVGFYARLFAQLASDLDSLQADRKVCIAVLTNVLPAHWWNWTFTADEWRAYTAISNLREQMIEMAAAKAKGNGAQVDRIIAVRREPRDVVGELSYEVKKSLWSEQLLYDMLTNWQLLYGPNGDPLKCAYARQGTMKDALELFPPPIKKGAECSAAGATLYPMLSKQHQTASAFRTDTRTWQTRPLCDEYAKLHGQHGQYWVLAIPEDGPQQEFGQRFDAMFIGLGPADAGSDRDKGGLWGLRETDNVEWGLCLMASLDARVETMFLTVISGDSVKRQYRWWSENLGERVHWQDDLLPQAASRRRPAKSIVEAAAANASVTVNATVSVPEMAPSSGGESTS